jgi:hypothetical protein
MGSFLQPRDTRRAFVHPYTDDGVAYGALDDAYGQVGAHWGADVEARLHFARSWVTKPTTSA